MRNIESMEYQRVLHVLPSEDRAIGQGINVEVEVGKKSKAAVVLEGATG